MALDAETAYHWIKELELNITEFRKKSRYKPESKLDFISKQYASLFALVRVNRGDALMKGFPYRAIEEAHKEQEVITEQ